MSITVWDIYFANLVAMQEHPGYNRENATKRTLEECAEIADEMLKYRPEEK